MCGKNTEQHAETQRRKGSPPRVREKHKYEEELDDELGITPACAGKTTEIYRILSAYKDHPRVCGKNFARKNNSKGSMGSPPRVREKLSSLLSKAMFQGITPACAGKTVDVQCMNYLEWDHPRVCGKN